MDIAQDLQDLKESVSRIEKRLELGPKKILTVNEVANLLQLSTDRVYALVNQKLIPHYRTFTKRIWFDREEVENWMKAERVTPDYELMKKAAQYTAKKH